MAMIRWCIHIVFIIVDLAAIAILFWSELFVRGEWYLIKKMDTYGLNI